jgi:hypothetical protein
MDFLFAPRHIVVLSNGTGGVDFPILTIRMEDRLRDIGYSTAMIIRMRG